MRGRARTTGGAGPLLTWAASRTLVLLYVFKVFTLPGGLDVTTDVSVIYQGWFRTLAEGVFPADDVTWQYPPAAALAILSPALLTVTGLLDYAPAFFVLACAADALVLVLLLYASRAGSTARTGTHRRTPRRADTPEEARRDAPREDGPDAPRGTVGADGTDGAARAADAAGSAADGSGNGTAGRRRSRAGAWLWIAGVPLLGPTVYARYDLMVTALAVAALLAAARHPRTAGALAGLGAMVKVWPALLLLGTPRSRTGRTVWTAALVTAAALTAGFALTMPHALDFLTAQGGRGTEVESVPALALHLARLLAGWEGTVELRYGSMEFIGPGVWLVSDAALALTVLGFGWLLLWRLRARTWAPGTLAHAAFAAVLVFTTTSRVLSPQYLVWLVGLAAVCLAVRAAGQALPAGLVLVATGLTLLEFPVGFSHVVGSDLTGVTLLLARNGLLVAATFLCCARLWRSTVPRGSCLRHGSGDEHADGAGSEDGGGDGTGSGDGGGAVADGRARPTGSGDELLTW